MADRAVIQASPRQVLGKQVKQLRRQGILPANVYGKSLESQALQLDAREFGRTIKTSGVRGMFELKIEGERAQRHVIIRGMTRKGGTGDVAHVDFFQVDPNKPILANVPIRLVGDAPAVKDLAGVLIASLEVLHVRCKPLDIPEAIEVDVSPLKSFEVSLTVADIKAPSDVEILTDPAVVVATVNAPRVRAEDEEAEAAAAEEEEGAEGEGDEGEGDEAEVSTESQDEE